MQLKRNNSPRTQAHDAPAHVMWPRIAVLSSVAVLIVIGLVMVYSASSILNIDAAMDPTADAVKQLFYAAVGIAACAAIGRFVPYHWWRGGLTWAFFAISLVLLVLTAAIGTVGLGAQRWLTLGPINLQPSEFAKIGVLLVVAKIVADYRDGMLTQRQFLVSFGVLNILIVGLIYLAQSDLGTTIICFVGMIAILWIAEVETRIILVYVAGIVAVGGAGLSQGYRLERMLSFTHPWDDYYGSGYQIIHSMYAFAQGGIFGTGLGNSAEKYLYLPEAHTDFIFSIIGEELGLIGAFVVLAMFVLFLLGGLRMAQAAPDGFGTLLCASFAITIVFQAFLNIGCVIGALPITGKPLPFVSAGGSSLITSFIMVGIMLSISRASGESPEYQRRRASIHPVGWDDYGSEYRSASSMRRERATASVGRGVYAAMPTHNARARAQLGPARAHDARRTSQRVRPSVSSDYRYSWGRGR